MLHYFTALSQDFRIRFQPRFHPIQYSFVDPACDLAIGVGGTATLELAMPTGGTITIVDPVMLSTACTVARMKLLIAWADIHVVLCVVMEFLLAKEPLSYCK